MIRDTPRSTRTDTLFPYPTLCRARLRTVFPAVRAAPDPPAAGRRRRPRRRPDAAEAARRRRRRGRLEPRQRPVRHPAPRRTAAVAGRNPADAIVPRGRRPPARRQAAALRLLLLAGAGGRHAPVAGPGRGPGRGHRGRRPRPLRVLWPGLRTEGRVVG